MSDSPYELLQSITLEGAQLPLMSFDGYHLWTSYLVRMPISKSMLARFALAIMLRVPPPSKLSRKDKREAYGQMLTDLFAHLFNLPVVGATEPEI